MNDKRPAGSGAADKLGRAEAEVILLRSALQWLVSAVQANDEIQLTAALANAIIALDASGEGRSNP